jgi:hypothetical protein
VRSDIGTDDMHVPQFEGGRSRQYSDGRDSTQRKPPFLMQTRIHNADSELRTSSRGMMPTPH